MTFFGQVPVFEVNRPWFRWFSGGTRFFRGFGGPKRGQREGLGSWKSYGKEEKQTDARVRIGVWRFVDTR